MFSHRLRTITLLHRARFCAPLALVCALPLTAIGDEPSPAKPSDAPPPAVKPAKPKTELRPRPLPTPQAKSAPRDLLYRGEKAGPYHAIYLRGLPPGVRIKGVTPPPIFEPQTRLVAPKAKIAPRTTI